MLQIADTLRRKLTGLLRTWAQRVGRKCALQPGDTVRLVGRKYDAFGRADIGALGRITGVRRYPYDPVCNYMVQLNRYDYLQICAAEDLERVW